MFGTKHSNANQLQQTIEYRTNEQKIKYLNWNMQIEKPLGKVSICGFCFYLFVLS